MRISKIWLRNWKNFRRAEVEMPYRVFIVGPNASGKSNFLDAIRFLRDIVKQGGGLQEAVHWREGVSKIRCMAARKDSDITIGIIVNNLQDKPVWEYELTFNQVGGGISDLKAIVKRESLKDLTLGFGNDNYVINRVYSKDSDKKNSESSYQLNYTYIEQPAQNEKFRDFVEFLSEISYLQLIPQLVRDPKSFLKTTEGEDYFGRDFLDKIQRYNKRTRNSFLNKISLALQYALPNLDKIEFVNDEIGIPHFEATFQHWRAKGIKLKEKHFSDGTLRLIGLLWALQDGTKPLLLEEPELHLHSSVVSHLPEIIYSLQKRKSGKRQVILTTHNHDILNNAGISSEEILLVQVEGAEGSTIESGCNIQEVTNYLKYDAPVGDLIKSKTSPKNIDQLILEFNGFK